MRSRAVIIFNSAAGIATGDAQLRTIQDALQNQRIDAAIRVIRSGEDITAAAYDAAASDVGILVAAGGDGTISAVSRAVIDREKILAVVPLGTLNHFSKDVGVPEDIAGAVSLLKGGVVKNVDVGEVGGRYFINNSSIGLYPRIVLKREKQQRLGRGKWWAAAWAVWRIFVRSPFLKTKLDLNGNVLHRKTPFIFVGNNDYEMDLYNIGRRLTLDDGCLSVYLLRRNGRVGLMLLVLHTLFGRLRQLKDFEGFKATKLSIATRKKRILVALDGEVTVMETPLRYQIHPKKLRVLVPRGDD